MFFFVDECLLQQSVGARQKHLLKADFKWPV